MASSQDCLLTPGIAELSLPRWLCWETKQQLRLKALWAPARSLESAASEVGRVQAEPFLCLCGLNSCGRRKAVHEQKKTSPFRSSAASHLLKTHSFPLAGKPECDIRAAAKDWSRARVTSKKAAPKKLLSPRDEAEAG